jgi:hypothetical protein
MQSFKHPQYLTPDGYVREKRNPSMRLKLEAARKKVRDARKRREMELLNRVRGAGKTTPIVKKKGISPEAAQMIAQALSGMMH